MLRLCKCGIACKSPPCAKCCPKKSKNSYDHQWRRLSERVRKENPLCHDCFSAGRTSPSTEVHHIVPVEVNPALRLVLGNLVALCHQCHKDRHNGNLKGFGNG